MPTRGRAETVGRSACPMGRPPPTGSSHGSRCPCARHRSSLLCRCDSGQRVVDGGVGRRLRYPRRCRGRRRYAAQGQGLPVVQRYGVCRRRPRSSRRRCASLDTSHRSSGSSGEVGGDPAFAPDIRCNSPANRRRRCHLGHDCAPVIFASHDLMLSDENPWPDDRFFCSRKYSVYLIFRP